MTLLGASWFWQHEYWLPPGITWEDMKETQEIRYPQPQHLLVSVPITLLLVAARFIFERTIAEPLSQKMGLREKIRRKALPNPLLEAFYTTHNRSPKESLVPGSNFCYLSPQEVVRLVFSKKWLPNTRPCNDRDELTGLSKQCDLQPRQVERWFRYRRNQDRPSLTKKFCEASWRTTFYLTSFCTGIAVLYDKPWFWDHRECWVGYPQQPLLPSIFGYYMLELSFYLSLVVTLPFDVKRKDFREQIIHHAITIFLICFSYCANYIRIGTLVMIIHDASDCLLEPTKIFNYLKWRRICDFLFIVFSTVFLFTRLVIFPYKVLYNTYYYSMELFQPFFGYYLMNALLMILQLLHIFWSCLIIHMVYKFILCGTMEKDLRSDSDESEKDEEGTKQRKEANRNGTLHSSPNGNGDCISKETPLQLNNRTQPTNSQAKSR